MTASRFRTGDRSPLGTLLSLLQVAVMGVAYLITFLPRGIDRSVVATLRSTVRVLGRRRLQRLAETMEKHLDTPSADRSWDRIAVQHITTRLEGHWSRARAIHRRGWQPTLELEGLEHLEAALERGRGVVVWRMQLCSSHIPKQALARVGHPMIHLSRPSHGTRHQNTIGRRVFAPLYTRSEHRHLGEVVSIPEDGGLGYLRTLLDRLDRNAIVSMFGEFEARASTRRNVHGFDIDIATGAPSLARRCGAALLTMHAERLGWSHYRVVIGAPIEPTARNRAEFLGRAVDEYSRRLGTAIAAHPADWYGWP